MHCNGFTVFISMLCQIPLYCRITRTFLDYTTSSQRNQRGNRPTNPRQGTPKSNSGKCSSGKNTNLCSFLLFLRINKTTDRRNKTVHSTVQLTLQDVVYCFTHVNIKQLARPIKHIVRHLLIYFVLCAAIFTVFPLGINA